MKQEFDLIINGGGMAGATLAWGLNHILGSAHQLKIAIIEASPDDDAHPGFDARVIALSYGSRQILAQLALWQDFKAIATPISQISVTDRGHFGQTTINPQDYDVASLGYVVELADSGQVLQQKLANKVTWFRPNTIAKLKQSDSQVDLELADGQCLSAKLLVAADGGFSTVRQLLNLGNQQTHFNQSAIIANITTSKAHQGIAYERFTEQGPLALLPMSQGRSSLVWSMHNQHIDSLISMNETDFLAQLQQAFGFRLGTFEQTGKRVSYPLIQTLAQDLCHHRTVFIGNAAQALHPIAGQGFNLGLRDVAGLIAAIKEAVINQTDIGEHSTLTSYQALRTKDRSQTVAATSSLVSLFSNKHWPLVVGRNVGLKLSNCIEAIKAPVAHQMLGWRHDLPMLTQINSTLTPIIK